ncbi:MAG: HAMP domain-containing histidine kinase [Propionibacteriaceae bacterium]|jgi:two-component system sensor histidine kinase MtrB|nr:HAMP domain-containing histidine kinase [Propionibacteriaceae bacterium]
MPDRSAAATTPLRWWRSSLTLRVVTLATAGTLVAILVAGVFLLRSVTEGLVTRAQGSALTDANAALSQIEQALSSSRLEQLTSSEVVPRIAADAIPRGLVGQRYYTWIRTPLGAWLTQHQVDRRSIPDDLLAAVDAEPGEVHWQPTQVHYLDGSESAPGLAVGATVGGPTDQVKLRVYFVFPLTQEAQTLRVVQTALALSGTVVVIAMAVVAYAVARLTLRPIRVARQAAERLASGELTQPMPVRGTDDLARLAWSMNHMADQLQLRIGQLEELSRLQQRFVSDVSHELRTPLTTVRMAADMVYDSRHSLGEIEQRAVVLLRQELDRFEALLADLLEISRFDAGAAVLILDEADLVELVASEIETLAKLSRAAGAEVRFHHDDGPCLAQVDVRRVSRLVRNLLSNAIEHSEGRPIDVTVKADDAVVAIAVRDHGVGFSGDQAKHLFSRFWRADPARARHIGGTGLGLAISQEDVHLHRGSIHAWGRPSQGAQFRVTLPRRPDQVVVASPLPLVPLDAESKTPSASLAGSFDGRREVL